MGWFILFVVIGIIGASLKSLAGKFVLGAGALVVGLLIIQWITDIELFAGLAKLCGVAIVVVILWKIISALAKC